MTRRRFAAEAGFLLAAVLVGLAVNCLVVAFRAAREDARSSQCRANIGQIGFALINYHGANKSFPPAYTLGRDGRRSQSWRALCMCSTETWDSLDHRYDKSVPWNESPNAALLAREGSNFAFWCPSVDPHDRKTTDYVAVVDPSTAWPGERPMKLEEIGDGPENTILLVEVFDSGIGWTEPRDFGLEQFLDGVARTHHDGYFYAVFADWKVRRISSKLPRDVLRALLTANAGEKVDLDAIRP